jgi:hypothetical protein
MAYQKGQVMSAIPTETKEFRNINISELHKDIRTKWEEFEAYKRARERRGALEG